MSVQGKEPKANSALNPQTKQSLWLGQKTKNGNPKRQGHGPNVWFSMCK
jgi:hypothetical protein